ncbi:unnamed protein product, partial [Coccothraustes coccothraustes]
MAASALFILDLKGKPLISRNYKGDVGLGEIEHFMGVLLQREEEGTLSPVLTYGHVHFLWIKHANLYLVATTKKNGNASLVFSFLYKVVEVFCEYFKELEEESIRDNFVIVYELLDKLMDFGFPQTTDSKILQEYITQEGNKLETGKSRVPTTVTNAVSWRSEGIRYKKNEVFIDVIEAVNLLVSANGSVVLSEVVGTIKLKVFLSGMPELRLGLNDRVLFELTGRECRAGGLSPVPPDPPEPPLLPSRGQEQVGGAGGREVPPVCPSVPLRQRPHHLLHPPRWRLRAHVLPPAHAGEAAHLDRVHHREVLPQPGGDHGQGQGPVQEAVGGQRRGDLGARAQRRRLAQVQDHGGVGAVPAGEERGHLEHQVLPRGKEHLMRAHFGLPSVEKEEEEGRPPIAVRFEIPYFTVSGIQVRYMKIIEKSGYQALPWVRYITQRGNAKGRGVLLSRRRNRKCRAVTWAAMAEPELRVNAAFAERYGRYRRREELQRLRDRYGDPADSSDSSSSSPAGRCGPGPPQEREFYRTLALLKTRPRIYRQDTAFYSQHDCGGGGGEEEEEEEEERPMFLKDYERKVVLEQDGKYVDEEDEEDEEARGQAEEGLGLPQLRRGAAGAQGELPSLHRRQRGGGGGGGGRGPAPAPGALPGGEGPGGGAVPALAAGPGRAPPEPLQDLEPLQRFWSDPALEPGERFLRDYLLGNGFREEEEEEQGDEGAAVPPLQDSSDEGEQFLQAAAGLRAPAQLPLRGAGG